MNPNIISTFGFSSSKDVDKFENVEIDVIDNIPVVLEGTTGYILCEVENILDCETHDIIVATVKKENKTSDLKPMTYTYYHEVIKGKAPKYAPTYVEEDIDVSSLEKYKCTICGYVVDGPLLEGFICPICGRPHEYFEKIS